MMTSTLPIGQPFDWRAHYSTRETAAALGCGISYVTDLRLAGRLNGIQLPSGAWYYAVSQVESLRAERQVERQAKQAKLAHRSP